MTGPRLVRRIIVNRLKDETASSLPRLVVSHNLIQRCVVIGIAPNSLQSRKVSLNLVEVRRIRRQKQHPVSGRFENLPHGIRSMKWSVVENQHRCLLQCGQQLLPQPCFKHLRRDSTHQQQGSKPFVASSSGNQIFSGAALGFSLSVDDLTAQRPSVKTGRIEFKTRLIRIDEGVSTELFPQLTQLSEKSPPS